MLSTQQFPKRRGFSFIELQVAFLVFGVALAGLVPLVVMQQRQVAKLQSELQDNTRYYLTPSANEWARKLGVPAQISQQRQEEADEVPSVKAVHEVSINNVNKTLTGETVVVNVTVKAIKN